MPETKTAGLDSPRACLIVVAAFFASFVAFGVSYSFGVFLKPMAAEFGVSHAVMSSLFSVLTVLSLPPNSRETTKPAPCEGRAAEDRRQEVDVNLSRAACGE